MTPKEQQKAIEESLRLTNVGTREVLLFNDGNSCIIKDERRPVVAPDFLNDLNAMHEVEETLKGDQWDTYYKYLWDNANYTSRGVIAALHATAAQRAEAYLRTIGKWKD